MIALYPLRKLARRTISPYRQQMAKALRHMQALQPYRRGIWASPHRVDVGVLPYIYFHHCSCEAILPYKVTVNVNLNVDGPESESELGAAYSIC